MKLFPLSINSVDVFAWFCCVRQQLSAVLQPISQTCPLLAALKLAEACMHCAGTGDLENDLIHYRGKHDCVVAAPDCSTAVSVCKLRLAP